MAGVKLRSPARESKLAAAVYGAICCTAMLVAVRQAASNIRRNPTPGTGRGPQSLQAARCGMDCSARHGLPRRDAKRYIEIDGTRLFEDSSEPLGRDTSTQLGRSARSVTLNEPAMADNSPARLFPWWDRWNWWYSLANTASIPFHRRSTGPGPVGHTHAAMLGLFHLFHHTKCPVEQKFLCKFRAVPPVPPVPPEKRYAPPAAPQIALA